MYTLRGFGDRIDRLARRIRGVVRHRRAIHVGELGMRMGMHESDVRYELQKMRMRDEVDRLRPLDYHPQEDYDLVVTSGGRAGSLRSCSYVTSGIQQYGKSLAS